MANKKEQSEFVVTDRRRFTDEGERQVAPQPEPPKDREVEQKSAPRPEPAPEAEPAGENRPAPPTAEERAHGSRAYKQSTDALDDQLRKEVGAQAVADEFKENFERVLEPFYVTAMMQLGLMGQEGPQRRVDIIGARQTIDTLHLLQEKTKGNLTQAEADLLESILYQLRMQYLEVTNALARAVQNPQGGAPNIPRA
jgi:hypothetical protein